MENKFLFNDRIVVRFISLFVVGTILFTVAWRYRKCKMKPGSAGIPIKYSLTGIENNETLVFVHGLVVNRNGTGNGGSSNLNDVRIA